MILRCAGLAAIAMIFSIGFSFQHAFQLMGEHHEKHIAQEIHDHPAMMSHKIGTEPLEVSYIQTTTKIFRPLCDSAYFLFSLYVARGYVYQYIEKLFTI